MNKPLTLYRLLLLAAGLLSFSSCRSDTGEASTIPNFTQTELDRHLGQVVVLNFWAAWCAPCRSEMPALQEVYEEYGNQGLVVLGINVSESGAEVAKFAESRNLTFPMFTDPDQEFMKAHNIRSLPTTLFINTDGKVVKRHVGSMTRAFLQGELEPLLQ